MDKKKQLIYLELTLIIILIICSLTLEFKNTNYKRDCKETYDLNKSCPCRQTKFNENYSSLLFSPLNLSSVKLPN